MCNSQPFNLCGQLSCIKFLSLEQYDLEELGQNCLYYWTEMTLLFSSLITSWFPVLCRPHSKHTPWIHFCKQNMLKLVCMFLLELSYYYYFRVVTMEQWACAFMEGLTWTSRAACLKFEINCSTLSNFITLITDELPPSLSQARWELQNLLEKTSPRVTRCRNNAGFLNSFS